MKAVLTCKSKDGTTLSVSDSKRSYVNSILLTATKGPKSVYVFVDRTELSEALRITNNFPEA